MNTIAPDKKTKTSIDNPRIIKTLLMMAPMIREVVLKINTSKYLVKLNPLL